MNRLLFVVVFTFLILPIFSIAQNVGIGTEAPMEKLDVHGNIKVDTIKTNALLLSPDAGAGKILTSDVIGNATWQPMMLPPENNESGNVGYGVWGDCATNGNISAYQPIADTAATPNEIFGISVSISGQFALAGALQDNVGLGAQGSASIYQHDGVHWTLFQKLTDPEGSVGDRFGNAVSISGDYAIVGSPDDDDSFDNQGSVLFFHYNGSSWDLLEKLYQDVPGQFNRFGKAVSISGEYAIVGAPGENSGQGSASIYQFNGNNWILFETIEDASGASGDAFGTSVHISELRAIVGAYGDDIGSNPDQGSASIFEFNGTNWSLMQKVTGTFAGDFFGSAVSVSGNSALIGVPGRDVNSFDEGIAFLYKFNGTNWISQNSFRDFAANNGEEFGTSVFLSGQFAMVGAPKDISPEETIQTGSVYIYRNVGLGWQKFQVVFDPGSIDPWFGTSISMDNQTGYFIIGSPNYAANSGKIIFGKIN